MKTCMCNPKKTKNEACNMCKKSYEDCVCENTVKVITDCKCNLVRQDKDALCYGCCKFDDGCACDFFPL